MNRQHEKPYNFNKYNFQSREKFHWSLNNKDSKTELSGEMVGHYKTDWEILRIQVKVFYPQYVSICYKLFFKKQTCTL